MLPASHRPVLTKADGARRYRAGEFGNASPSWDTPEALCEHGRAVGSDYGRYHLRNARIAGGDSYYDLSWIDAFILWHSQADPSAWYVSAMAPHERTLLQGEVQRLPGGLYLYYSTVPAPMRQALRSARSASGIIALEILRGALCPNSQDWLGVLLDRYPDHVVEFSAFSVEWGTLSGFNTVIWEVRSY